MSENVLLAILSVIGAAVVAFFTHSYRVQVNKKRDQPNRMENVFDGYEGLIKQLHYEIERKGKMIDQLQIQVDQQQKLIVAMREELEQSQNQSDQLQVQLDKMKEDYKLQTH